VSGFESLAPSYRKIPFIKSGYRLGYTFNHCIHSLFQLHNETVNAWSHLLGALYWLYQLYYVPFWLSMEGANKTTIFLTWFFVLGCFASTIFSFLFHQFNCINVHCHDKLRALDFAGITISIWGISLPVLYSSFYCYPNMLIFYTALCTVSTFILFQLQLYEFLWINRGTRIVIYVVASLLPLINYLNILYLEGLTAPLMFTLFDYIIIGYFFYGSGVFIYSYRFPERLFPGFFDIWGSSHQIWHIFILLGQYSIYHGIWRSHHFISYGQPCKI